MSDGHQVRKKDVKELFDLLSPLMGDFAFMSHDGKLIVGRDDGCAKSYDIEVNGMKAGSVCGPGEGIKTAASLFQLHLKGIDERKKLTLHTLQKYRELNFLSELNHLIGASADIDGILGTATKKIHEMIEVESVSIFVVAERKKILHIKAVSGRAVNEDTDFPMDAGIMGRVIASGHPVIANEPAKHEDFISRDNVINNLICVPLKVKDKTIGAINLTNKKDGVFTSEDESLIMTISSIIAESIENARLIEATIRNEKFSAIGQMAAGIIHDIKNPMTTIKGFAGLLGDMDFTIEERKEYSSLIVGEVNRLVSMVEDLLAFTRGFKTSLSLQKISIQDLIDSIAPFVEKDMSARGIDVVKSINGDGNLNVDVERLKRVIFNISGNAREVMHNGGKFLIMCRVSGDWAEIVMADTGEGIPEDIIDTVFEPFVTKGKKTGTGLGLAITQKIVQEHGGSIRAENGNYSGMGGFDGANFIIKLPYAN